MTTSGIYERVLVAIDGSPGAAYALRHAIGLASRSPAALRLVHVLDIGWLAFAPELALHTERIAAAKRAAGEAVLAQAQSEARAAGLDASAALLETGSPREDLAAAIAAEADRWKADVVVVGTQGHRALGRVVLGSVAERLARRSPVPLLLVPGDATGT